VVFRSSVLKACALLVVAALTACSSDSGPSCVPVVFEPIIVRFPIYAPGAAIPFANARLRQEYTEYDGPSCPVPVAATYLRFEPLVPAFVRFGYRLDYRSDATDWFYVGEVGFNGLLTPTNDVLVSRDPDPIDLGEFLLTFTYFTPL
jgi:hypothetical protein